MCEERAGGAGWDRALTAAHLPPPFRPPSPVPPNPPKQTGIAGGLSLWDTRAPGSAGPVRHAAPPNTTNAGAGSGGAAGDVTAAAACQTLCLDVHPSRPHLAATGGAGGCPVALWDLRASACAAALLPPPVNPAVAAGLPPPDVWEVRFDPAQHGGEGAGGGVPLLFCTSDGGVWRAHLGAVAAGGRAGAASLAPPPPPRLLAREEASVNSFDVEPQLGRDLVAASDNECLMFRRRAVLMEDGGDGGGGGGGMMGYDE